MINCIKRFDTFEEGIKDVRKMVPFLNGYIGDKDDEISVVYNIIEEIKRHYPSVDNPEYPAVPAFSITAHEVGFKTSGFCSFGWKIKDNKKGYYYSFRITIEEHQSRISNEATLRENGWTIIKIEDKHKKSYKKSINKEEDKPATEEPVKVEETTVEAE